MDSYSDLANRREVYIQRYASHLRNEYLTTGLTAIYKATREVILDAESIDSIAQRTALNKAIKEAVEPISNEMWLNTTGELQDLAAQESSYYAKMFSGVNAVAMSVPAAEKVIIYADKARLTLDSKKGVWTYFVNRNKSSIIKQIQAQINSGYRNNETVFQMAKRVKRVSEGLLNHQAESLVRTGAAHFSESARREMFNDNLDIVDREIPNVTFDNRITRICMSISAKYPLGWKVNESPIGYPPYHFGCRTIIERLVKGQTHVDGTKAFVGGKDGEAAEDSFNARNQRLINKRNNEDYDGGVASQVRRKGNNDKAFDAGQISNETPFSTFLKDQPRWFVDDTLGKERADLFMAGKLDLSKLTDRNLKPLTLKQIENK